MKKAIYSILIILAAIVVLFGLLFSGIAVAYSSPEFARRCILALWEPTAIKDYLKYPYRDMNNASPVFNFKKELNEGLVKSAFSGTKYRKAGKEMPVGDMDTFLRTTDTTALIVIKGDTIVYEKYFNGYQRDSINTSFSVAKSYVSTMIGMAIEDGYIKGVEEPIINYLPEFDRPGYRSVTIRNLMDMSSGIHYEESFAPWGDNALTYLYPDLRKSALKSYMDGEPGKYFWYNNYHPLLEGMIIEKATHKNVATYLQDKLWSKLGTEFPATWSTDSKETNFEKMESGINARSIDFAKFGRLFLHNGNWEGTQVISSAWVKAATVQNDATRFSNTNYYSLASTNPAFRDRFFTGNKCYYQYHWWGWDRGNGDYDYSACGALGQYIYVSPSRDLIIVRNGKSRGGLDSWPEIFFSVASQFPSVSSNGQGLSTDRK